jgi:hypothetical protein
MSKEKMYLIQLVNCIEVAEVYLTCPVSKVLSVIGPVFGIENKIYIRPKDLK